MLVRGLEHAGAIDDPPGDPQGEKHLRDGPGQGQEISAQAQDGEEHPEDLAICGVRAHGFR